MSSVFTKIIKGELPGHFVWSDETCVSFLSINPVTNGHALVVPRLEIDHWLDLSSELIMHLMLIAQIVGKGQMQAFSPLRIGQLIAGLEVPHTHLHLIPMQGMSDLDLTKAPKMANQETLENTAMRLRNAIISAGHDIGL
jgi:histidine triad (HIT) family protein